MKIFKIFFIILVSVLYCAAVKSYAEIPSGCNECFKVVVEKPFSQDPSNNFEAQWQAEGIEIARGICREACSDKGCKHPIPCGEKPVERQEIYPDNLYFDASSGRASEGIKVRIGIYYKCISLVGDEIFLETSLQAKPVSDSSHYKTPEAPVAETPEAPVAETPEAPVETSETPGVSTTTAGETNISTIPLETPKIPPKTNKKNKLKDVIPKLSTYSRSGVVRGGSDVGEDGKLMVPAKVMERIRSTTRNQETQEDCCNRAERDLQRCYNVESRQVYNKCMDEFMGGASGTVDALVGAYTGAAPSEIYDALCKRRELEYEVGCMEKCLSRCPKRCACSSLNKQLTVEIFRLLYPSGSTSAPGAPGNQGDKALSAGEMPR